jgi:3-methyl-2-oxobutanoate hydroxymethyltransferase
MYTQFKPPSPHAPVTVPRLRELKAHGHKIVALTAYDASFAAQCDAAGIDLILVGDSLGMVVQGRSTTLPVTLDDIVYHAAAVARGSAAALLVADLPFMTYRDPGLALASAARAVAEGGAAMVKVEGAGPVLDVIRALARHDIPACAHLGLTPRVPKFVKRYGDLGPGIEAAVAGYASDVRARAFPGNEHVYSMKKK